MAVAASGGSTASRASRRGSASHLGGAPLDGSAGNCVDRVSEGRAVRSRGGYV